MQASKRVIFCLALVFILTVCNSCDIQGYSSVCDEDSITTTIVFNYPFDGTVYANGFIGNPNCSSPNMEISNSNAITLKLPFLECNTSIRRFEAVNIITIQFHPLVRSKLDCEILTTCHIGPLSQEFLRKYLKNNLKLPTPIKSKVDIMSGEKLFGDEIAGWLGIGQKQYLTLNVTIGGRHEQLRIRKCYAHTRYVVDQITDPDLLLDDNPCTGKDFLKWASLKADNSYSDLSDFSETQHFEMSFTRKSFYITCAFDMCSDSCLYNCFEKTEINKGRWSTIQTNKVELLDKSFKGFRKPKLDLRTTAKNLYDRVSKLRDQQIAHVSTTSSKRITSNLNATKPAANINASTEFQEKPSTEQNESDEITQLDKEISTGIYMPKVLENISVVSANQDATKHSYENSVSRTTLNSSFSETKTHGHFGKRSIAETGTNYSDTISPINVDSPLSEIVKETILVKNQLLTYMRYANASNDTGYFNSSRSLDEDAGIDDESIDDKSMELMNGTDCFNTSCFPNEDASASVRSKKFKNVTACFNIPCKPNENGDVTSKKVMNSEGDDCFNSSCRPDDDAGIILVTENLVIKDSSLKFDEMTIGSSGLNFTAKNDVSLAPDTSHKKDCVPYLKFVSVATSLSVLCGCCLIIALFLILFVRKERKKFNSHCKHLYTDFRL